MKRKTFRYRDDFHTSSIDQNFDRKRVLFLVESVTLAHPARAITLAQSLDPARYEVRLVSDPRYLALFDRLEFPVHPIRSIKSSVFHDRLATGDSTLFGCGASPVRR